MRDKKIGVLVGKLHKQSELWKKLGTIFNLINLLAIAVSIIVVFYINYLIYDLNENFSIVIRYSEVIPSVYIGIPFFILFGSFALKKVSNEMSFIQSMRTILSVNRIEEKKPDSLALERLKNSKAYVFGYLSLFFSITIMSVFIVNNFNVPFKNLLNEYWFLLALTFFLLFVFNIVVYKVRTKLLNEDIQKSINDYHKKNKK